MRNEVPDLGAIQKEAHKLLLLADAIGRLPTPVDDIVAAAGLTEPKESLLSDFIIEQAPAHIRLAMTKIRFKVQALLDRKTKEVHVDPSLDMGGRAAFKKLHEVAHHVLPWQQELAYADDHLTLAWTTARLFERQANQGSAELLFQGGLFKDRAREYRVGIAAIHDLANIFGASFHASFRRFVEVHRDEVMGLVLEPSPCSAVEVSYRRREALCSEKWAKRFGDAAAWPALIRDPPYSFVQMGPDVCLTGQTKEAFMVLPDVSLAPVTLNVELYSNRYALFALIWVPARKRIVGRRRVLGAPVA